MHNILTLLFEEHKNNLLSNFLQIISYKKELHPAYVAYLPQKKNRYKVQTHQLIKTTHMFM